ncbi:MAG: hypothetical protein HY078_01805 [Elusimicrobia bacterium]|nr:hypothetical protein [Elusimicrobiota bacterium]
MNLRLLAVLWLLASSAASAGETKPIEPKAAPAAADKLAATLAKTKDPYARLWLVDALYQRVVDHSDSKAYASLVAAAADSNAQVRRRAVDALKSFKHLPNAEIAGTWLAAAQAEASRAAKDAVPDVRAAGAELESAVKVWKERAAKEKPEASAAPPVPGARGERETQAGGQHRLAGILVWTIAFQLLGFFWQKLGIALIKKSVRAAQPVFDAWDWLMAHPKYMLFPCASTLALAGVVGTTLEYALVLSAMPSTEPREAALGMAIRACLLYVLAGLCCFVPAAMLAASAAEDPRAELGMTTLIWRGVVRLPRFIVLGIVLLACWPLELLRRTLRLERRSWLFEEGAPFAGLSTAAVVGREKLGLRKAFQRAKTIFAGTAGAPESALFGRPFSQPELVTAFLATPALFAASVVPSMALKFSPARLFGFWFLSDGMFAIGFGLWASTLLCACVLAILLNLGAVHAAKRTTS